MLDLSDRYGHELGVTPPPQRVQRLEYHQGISGLSAEMRIVAHTRSLFFDDAADTAEPTGHLPFGKLGPRGLKYEDYKLALTDALLDAIFAQRDTAGQVVDDKLAWQLAPAAGATAAITARDILDKPMSPGSVYLKSGYILGSGIDAALAGQYWMRSGVAGFASGTHQHFYLPERYTDSFGNVTRLAYEPRDLLVQSTTDAQGNTVRVEEFDYRTLAPRSVTDANGNRTEGQFDVLGHVVALAIGGKQINGQWEGDNLTGFDFDIANPSTQAVVAFCSAQDANRSQARTWLGDATRRFVYHFGDEAAHWAQRPAAACSIAREQHVGQLAAGASSDLQIALECSDGSGRAMMMKVQAEPEQSGGAARWLVNGLTVLNNKGKPVKQYEPSFVSTFGSQLPAAFGVSSTWFYDAVGRTIRIEFPDGTLSRVEFSPWHARSFDQNDTVREGAWYARHSAATAGADERRAAALALNHADTPAQSLFDSLGREVIAVAHNRTPDANALWQDDFYITYTKLDAEGKALWIRDARGNLVMQYISPAKPTRLADTPGNPLDATDSTNEYLPARSAPSYDIAGNLLYQHSMDAGDQWMLTDAAGKPMLGWDVNERTLDDGSVLAERRLLCTRYDALHRPIEQWLRLNDDPAALMEAFEYVDVENIQGLRRRARPDRAQRRASQQPDRSAHQAL